MFTISDAGDAGHNMENNFKLVLLCERVVMKRLFVLTLSSFLTIVAIAQDSLENHGYFSLTAGPSFPVGDFVSNNIHKLNAGLAKKGYTIKLKYAHQLDDLFGFNTAFVYARFPIIKYSGTESPTAAVKPWEYYELLIGPMITGSIASRMFLDASVLSGTAFINASKANVDGRLIQKNYSTSAVPLRFAIDFRLLLNRRFYLFAGVNYNYMCANFNVTVESQELSFKQRMNSADINAGIGCNFY